MWGSKPKKRALSRTVDYRPLEKKEVLLKVLVASQFNYSPLVLMCHHKILNNKINNFDKRVSFHERFICFKKHEI